MSTVPSPGNDSTRGGEGIGLARNRLAEPAAAAASKRRGASQTRGAAERSAVAEGSLLVAATVLAVLVSWWSSPPSPGITFDPPEAMLSEAMLPETMPPEVMMRAPRLNIRTAPWYEWMLLEGIGAARARKIVTYREAIGGFRSIDDLEHVPGLPGGWMEPSRDLLTVGGD